MNYGKQFVYTLTRRYATFSGRASRREYWTFTIAWALILPVLQYIGHILLEATGVALQSYFLLVFVVVLLALPSLAVSVHRLHDLGKPWTWIFICLIPLIGTIWWLVLMLKPSQPLANRFGEVPLDTEDGR